MRAGVFSKGDAAATHRARTLLAPTRKYWLRPAHSRYPEEPCTRRRLCWRSRDTRRLAAIDACNQDNGTRPLLPDEIGQVRIPTRLLLGHQVRGFKIDDGVRAMCETVPVRASALGRVAVRESGSFNIGNSQHVKTEVLPVHSTRRAGKASPVPAVDRTAFHPRPPLTTVARGFYAF
jgi:hypothetical protein